MNGLKHIAKYIRRIEHVKGKLQPNLQSLAGKARSVIGRKPAESQLLAQNSDYAPSADYQPTPYLAHPFFQAVYNISEPRLKLQYSREKLFFEDGGHVSLDWALPLKLTETKGAFEEYDPVPETPIFFVMHGLTGGS